MLAAIQLGRRIGQDWPEWCGRGSTSGVEQRGWRCVWDAGSKQIPWRYLERGHVVRQDHGDRMEESCVIQVIRTKTDCRWQARVAEWEVGI